MPLRMEVGLGRGHIVLDEDPAPQEGHSSPLPTQFSAHVYCRQTVAHLSNCWAIRSCFSLGLITSYSSHLLDFLDLLYHLP